MMRGFVCFHTGRRPSIANIPPFVIAGLDPAIHCAAARDVVVEAEPDRSVDARVKPGHDERVGVAIRTEAVQDETA